MKLKYTTAEAAAVLDIKLNAVYCLLARKRLRHGTYGQHFVDGCSVERYLAERRLRRRVSGPTECACFRLVPLGLMARLKAAARLVRKNKVACFIEAVEEWCEKVEKGRK